MSRVFYCGHSNRLGVTNLIECFVLSLVATRDYRLPETINQTTAGGATFLASPIVAFVISGLAQNPTLSTKPNVT